VKPDWKRDSQDEKRKSSAFSMHSFKDFFRSSSQYVVLLCKARLIASRKHQSGRVAKHMAKFLRHLTSSNGTVRSTILNFVICTKESSENDPRVR
jgi:hypothetical protein